MRDQWLNKFEVTTTWYDCRTWQYVTQAINALGERVNDADAAVFSSRETALAAIKQATARYGAGSYTVRQQMLTVVTCELETLHPYALAGVE